MNKLGPFNVKFLHFVRVTKKNTGKKRSKKSPRHNERNYSNFNAFRFRTLVYFNVESPAMRCGVGKLRKWLVKIPTQLNWWVPIVPEVRDTLKVGAELLQTVANALYLLARVNSTNLHSDSGSTDQKLWNT